MAEGKNSRKRGTTANGNDNGSNGNGNGVSSHYLVVGPGGTVTSVERRMDALSFFGR